MAFEALESELGLDKSNFSRGLRDAAKETVAFGSVAEGTFDDVGDEAAAAGAEAAASSQGFDALAEAAGDAAIPARLAASSIDEAGDEASEAGRQAFGATAGFGALRLSTTGLSFSLGVLTTVGTSTILMLGGLAVAAGAVMTALLPIAIGATAIAAAFGLIVGSGIYAGMSELQAAFKSAREQIEPLVKEFGEQFVPFLKETIGMLPGLVKSILDAVGPMDQFLGALRTLRNVAFALLPKFIQWFMDLGRWALPIVTKLGKWIVESLAPALRQLVDHGKSLWQAFTRLAPQFQTLLDTGRELWNWMQQLWQQFQKSAEEGTSLRTEVQQLVKAAKRFWTNLQPVIQALKPFVSQLVKAAPIVAKTALDVGQLALNLGSKLLPYLVPLIDFLTQMVKWFRGLSGGIQRAIVVVGGLALALGPIISIVTTIVSVIGTFISILTTVGSVILTVVAFFNPLTLAIAALVAAVTGLYLAWKTNLFGIRDIVNNIFSKVSNFITDMITGAVSTAKSTINDLRTSIEDALSSAANWIRSTGRSMWEDSFGAMAEAAIAMYNSIMPDRLGIPEITIPRVELSIPGLTIAGERVYESQSVGVGPFGPFGGQSVGIPQLASGGFIESEGLAMLHSGEQVVPAAQVDRGGGGGGGPNQVIVQLDADAVKELLRGEAVDVFDSKIQDTERKKRRRGTF